MLNPSGGATYDAGGLCGLLFCPQTDKRAESPSFSTIGFNSIAVSFNYIENGDGLNDNATFWYYDGTSWAQIEDMPKTSVCGGGQGMWVTRTISLPASANNNPNIKIAFRWVNNDDGVGTDPSFAVDNIVVKSTTLSVSEFDLDSQIKFYPNPVNDILKIEAKKSGNYQIINESGQVVKEFYVIENTVNTIHLENLSSGVYFIKNEKISKKIIIK
ncbi:T9SS type A sorting domain-containing protein [Flavobacterium ajazii]|uniref:T9SS type A sorting domain-containing protein n=1 Tax=Flavobacterium ajazii TaxID=2692318 RepID=UPI0013D4B192|nr:T9SS type A sorting domain-containing protein [Flavobacterium ajazii]